MNNLFYYEVSWYLDSNEELQYGGFIYAESFADAAQKIEESYGKELISIDKLYGFDTDIMNLPVKFTRSWFDTVQKWENGYYDNQSDLDEELKD